MKMLKRLDERHEPCLVRERFENIIIIK